MVNMNGLPVYRVGDAIFVPLPKPLWRESGFPGKCKCGKCDGSGMWDTLAIAVEAKPHKDWTWNVHFPELHTPNASKAVEEAKELLKRSKLRDSRFE